MITLAWMVEQMKIHLAFTISVDPLMSQDRFILMRGAVDELIAQKKKDHWLIKKIDGLLAKEPKADPWNDGNKTRTKVLAADALRGWGTGPIIDSFQGEMKKAGSQYRTPGEYKEAKLQSGKVVKLGKTNEYIHPTVQYRKAQLGSEYDPVPLKSFKRQLRKENGKVVGYEWVKNDVRIPEYQIGGMTSIERSCVVSQAARAFMGRIDKDLGIDSWEARTLDAPPQPAVPENQGFQPNTGFPGFQNQAASDADKKSTSGFYPSAS